MSDEATRMEILEKLDNGQITADEALLLLQAVEQVEASEAKETQQAELESGAPAEIEQQAADATPPVETATVESSKIPEEAGAPAQEEAAASQPGETAANAEAVQPEIVADGKSKEIPNLNKWRRWWVYPFWIGVAVTILGSFFIAWVVQSTGVNFWLLCAGIPFFVGVILITIAWESRSAHWLHLRVHQKPGERPQNIAFSFPIPIRLTVWFVRNFGHKIPDLKSSNVDEIILALGETTSPDNPLYIEVDEGEDGEKVQIYIG